MFVQDTTVVAFTFRLYLPIFYLMVRYPEKVSEHLRDPEYAGRATGENAVGTGASLVCGCFVRFSMAIDDRSKRISEARFQSNGCGYMVAASEVAAGNLSGRALVELNSVDEARFVAFVSAKLGVLPLDRSHCVRTVLDSIRACFAGYRASFLEEFQGEKPLICTCFGVSEETVEAFIAANTPASVEEVTAAARAGGGCGSCRMLIQELIDNAVDQR